MSSTKHFVKTLTLGEMRPQLRFSSSLEIRKESVAIYLNARNVVSLTPKIKLSLIAVWKLGAPLPSKRRG